MTLIMTILSAANRQIDEMHLTMPKYVDGHILNIQRVYNTNVEDMCSGLSFLQYEVEVIKHQPHSKIHLQIDPGMSRDE